MLRGAKANHRRKAQRSPPEIWKLLVDQVWSSASSGCRKPIWAFTWSTEGGKPNVPVRAVIFAALPHAVQQPSRNSGITGSIF